MNLKTRLMAGLAMVLAGAAMATASGAIVALSTLRPSAPVFPSTDAGDWDISLSKGGLYTVTLHPDGRVDMVSDPEAQSGYEPVVGGYFTYRVPPADVAAVLAQAKAAGFWGLRSHYDGFAPDPAGYNYKVSIRVGGQSKSVREYLGLEAGMPKRVKALEDAIGQAAHVSMWEHAELRTLDVLDGAHFDYRSQQAATLVARAAGDEAVRNEVLLAMLDRNVPVEGGMTPYKFSIPVGDMEWPHKMPPLIELAAAGGRVPVVKRLIDMGALRSGEVVDPEKLNDVFREAVGSDSLAVVDLVLTQKPPMELYDLHRYDYPPTDVMPGSAPRGVSALFYVRSSPDAHEAAAIVERLIAAGARVDATNWDGTSVLMALSRNPGAADVLLKHGADINARDNKGRTALTRSRIAEEAIWLLDHGADPCVRGSQGEALIDHAKEWAPVIPAWAAVYKRLQAACPAA